MIMAIEFGNLFKWIFTDFFGTGIRMIDSIEFAIGGVRFSMLDMIIGTIVLTFGVIIVKHLFGFEINLSIGDYKSGRPHLRKTQTTTTSVTNGKVKNTQSTIISRSKGGVDK